MKSVEELKSRNVRKAMAIDISTASIRNDKRFQQIMPDLRERIAAAHRRADQEGLLR